MNFASVNRNRKIQFAVLAPLGSKVDQDRFSFGDGRLQALFGEGDPLKLEFGGLQEIKRAQRTADGSQATDSPSAEMLLLLFPLRNTTDKPTGEPNENQSCQHRNPFFFRKPGDERDDAEQQRKREELFEGFHPRSGFWNPTHTSWKHRYKQIRECHSNTYPKENQQDNPSGLRQGYCQSTTEKRSTARSRQQGCDHTFEKGS